MDKISMREWVATLEGTIDTRLNKLWKKESRIENGEAVQIEWQFEQTHIMIDIFWIDDAESVILKYLSPRTSHQFMWNGLNNRTVDRIMDRVAHLVMRTMYPPLEPEVNLGGA